MEHISVLLKETIEGLAVKPGDVFLDGTLGSAGHSKAACAAVGGNLTVIGIDRDEDALRRAEEALKGFSCTFSLEKGNFRNLDDVLAKNGVKQVDRILLDLGMSSNQIEESGRGFSFKINEPLLMTFSKEPSAVTALDIVNTYDKDEIIRILREYGEERFARQIAEKIVERRSENPITTTFELVAVIEEATPFFYHHRKIHPATKTFQALRIAVNDELGALSDAMEKGWNMLSKGGRMAIISFHSLEDRLVKNYFRDRYKEKTGMLITKKPITATREEIKSNPRSRSAKLRIIEKNK